MKRQHLDFEQGMGTAQFWGLEWQSKSVVASFWPIHSESEWPMAVYPCGSCVYDGFMVLLIFCVLCVVQVFSFWSKKPARTPTRNIWFSWVS